MKSIAVQLNFRSLFALFEEIDIQYYIFVIDLEVVNFGRAPSLKNHDNFLDALVEQVNAREIGSGQFEEQSRFSQKFMKLLWLTRLTG